MKIENEDTNILCFSYKDNSCQAQVRSQQSKAYELFITHITQTTQPLITQVKVSKELPS